MATITKWRSLDSWCCLTGLNCRFPFAALSVLLTWFGLLAPAGTPQNVLDKLHDETAKTLAMPQLRKKFDELGLEPIGNTPASFTAIIEKETITWTKVIKDAGIKLGN